MQKTFMTYANWNKLEEILKDLGVGYQVTFDDHNGTAEMIIEVQRMSVYRWLEGEKE